MYLVATIGPRSSSKEVISKIVDGGANAIRINLSHGNINDIDNSIEYIKKKYEGVKIILDIQGNKIRVSNKLKRQFYVDKGEKVTFCAEEDYDDDIVNVNEKVIPLAIKSSELAKGNFTKIYMKDGTMEFKVITRSKYIINTIVHAGGMVRAEKGCNIPSIDRKGWGLTEKDRVDIKYALSKDVDILCYSYCSYEEDCIEFKNEVFRNMRDRQVIPKLWGKIETKEGVNNIKKIAESLDGIVIARGDLVPETNLLALPIIQEKIIFSMKNQNKDIIVATHVLNSMKYSTKPTINELNDIYIFMKNGVNGFMLTGETTVGKNHREVVNVLKNSMNYYKDALNKIRKKNKSSKKEN